MDEGLVDGLLTSSLPDLVKSRPRNLVFGTRIATKVINAHSHT
jgi:hypothetical protein